MRQAISEFLNSGLLLSKQIDILQTQQFENFVQECYNRLENFYLRQQANENLKKAYVSLMKILKQQRVETMNMLMFCATYIAQKQYYYQHNQEESSTQNNQRLHLDGYHIIAFTLNGVIVSDQFIEANLKKYFSDKFMDYTRKIAPAPQYVKPTKFFGHSVQFPKLETDEGSEFAQTLSGIFKPPTKHKKLPIVLEDSQYEVRHQYKSPPVRRMKIDLNSLSPSLASALHRTSLGFEKPKIVNHPIMKSQLGELNFMQRLKELETDGEKKVETRVQKSYRQNIVEQHNLTYPPKEYFQKNIKVDSLFKNFLELKYVLDQRKETMSSIKDVNDYQPKVSYAPTYTPYLQIETPQPQKQPIKFYERASVELASPDIEKQASKFDIQAQTTKATFNPAANSTFFPQSNKSSANFNVSQNSFFQYMNKQKEYKQKFEKFLSNESSPDRNINQINTQLLKKQNFLKKSLQKIKHS